MWHCCQIFSGARLQRDSVVYFDREENFQEELNKKIYPWGPNNKMTLNGDKFEHLHVGNNLQHIKTSYRDPSDKIIEEKCHIKDLGVTISNDLSWTKHITEVVSRARLMSE